jgi:hypothetical protein
MLESQLRSGRVIVRLKRAVERTNRTDIAIAIQQRIANRASSSVCRFHNPGWARGQLQAPANRSRVYTGLSCLKISECDELDNACPVMQKKVVGVPSQTLALLPHPIFCRNVAGNLLKLLQVKENEDGVVVLSFGVRL